MCPYYLENAVEAAGGMHFPRHQSNPLLSHPLRQQLTEDVIWNKYDADKVETLKYLDLSRSKWRTVEVSTLYGKTQRPW